MNRIAIQREHDFQKTNIDYDGMPITISFIQSQEKKGLIDSEECFRLTNQLKILAPDDKNLPSFKEICHIFPEHFSKHSSLEFASPFNQLKFINTIPDYPWIPHQFQKEFKLMVLLQILRYFKQDLRTKYFNLPDDRSFKNGSDLIIKLLEQNEIEKIPTINWKKYYSVNPVYYTVICLSILCRDTNSKEYVDWAITELALYGLNPDN